MCRGRDLVPVVSELCDSDCCLDRYKKHHHDEQFVGTKTNAVLLRCLLAGIILKLSDNLGAPQVSVVVAVFTSRH